MQLSFKLPLLLLLFRFSQALPQTLPQAAAVAGDTIDDQNDIVADPTADVVPDEPDTFIIPVPPANDSQLFLNRNDGSVPDKATDKRDFDSYKSWVDVKQEPHPGTLPDSMTYPISVTRTNLLAFYKAAMAYSARQPQQDSVTNMGWLNFTQNGLSLTMTPRGTALQGAHKFSWADYNQMAWRLSEIVRHYTDENTKTWSGVVKTDDPDPAKRIPYVDVITSNAIIVHNGAGFLPSIDQAPLPIPDPPPTDANPVPAIGPKRLRRRANPAHLMPIRNTDLRMTMHKAATLVGTSILAALIEQCYNTFLRFPQTATIPSVDYRLWDEAGGDRAVPNAVVQIASATTKPLTHAAIMGILGKLNRMAASKGWINHAGKTNAIYGSILDKDKNIIAKYVVGDVLRRIPKCDFTPKTGVLGTVADWFFGCTNVKVEL